MKILVTGGAGFIGSHIADAYVSEGHDVVVVDNLSTGKKENVNDSVHFYEVDICDKEALKKVFVEEQIEVVNHQAAHASVPESVKDPIHDLDVNIKGSVNLAELCKDYGVKKFIFASTGGALYGDAEITPTPETYPAKPISPYGVAKLSFEHYLHYYYTVFGLNYTVLRYANVYGERQDPHGEAGVVAIFSKKIAGDEQPIIFGDGEQTRDYVYVGDVVEASVSAFNKDALNGAVNIGTGVETSVNELFRHIVSVSGKEVSEKHADGREKEQRRSVLDYSQAHELLAWGPEFVLGEKAGEEALKKTYEFFALQ
ncbi:SDR family NAD(P)-dependent oxidoreductase [Patescibacteria group bacterium]|nr:SDR family NAD(P)-dependent oxidoreductase [Patescibacteria group bacterium]